MMNKTDNKYDLKLSGDKIRSKVGTVTEWFSDKCVKLPGCTVSGLINHILINETYIIKTPNIKFRKQPKTSLKKKWKTPMLFANAKTSGALQRSAPCRKACHGCERCGVVDHDTGILQKYIEIVVCSSQYVQTGAASPH
jgi:hypothetical protein